MAMLDISVKYCVNNSVNTSGSNLSASSVKPPNQRKKQLSAFSWFEP